MAIKTFVTFVRSNAVNDIFKIARTFIEYDKTFDPSFKASITRLAKKLEM